MISNPRLRHHIGAMVSAVALLGVPTVLVADSDGYFCSGPRYLAYQFSFSDSLPGHNLFIVDLSDVTTPPTPVMVPLPDFQVHGLMCGDSLIQVLGWNHLYRITGIHGERPMVETISLDQAGSTPAGFEDQGANLAAYRPYTDRHPLPSEEGGAVCELLFGTGPLKDGEATGTTDLVCLDGAGNRLWSYRLYHGWIRE